MEKIERYVYASHACMSYARFTNRQTLETKDRNICYSGKHLIKISKLIARAPESYGFP
jgi:hypothetical protein